MGETENIFDYIRKTVGRPPDNLRVIGLVNVRLGSDRVPNKGIIPLGPEGQPVWWHCMKRAEKAAELAGIDLHACAVITSGKWQNDILVKQAEQYGYDCIRYDPEEDLPGRRLKALDKYGCDIALNIGADTPLAVVEHMPLMWEKIKKYNCGGQIIWRNHQRGGNPRHSIFEVVCAVGLAFRWDQLRMKAITPTLLGLQDYTIEVKVPELVRLIPQPRGSWYEMPDWFWEYWRWYVLELDNYEDAVMFQQLYDRFWRPGEIVSWKDCIDWIDADYRENGGLHHFNATRTHSALNQFANTGLDAQNEGYFLNFCEHYLAPEGAAKVYCYLCGEYLGWVERKHGTDHLHRPDGSEVIGEARVTCSSGHFRMWQHTLAKAVSAGSAVLHPSDALEFSAG